MCDKTKKLNLDVCNLPKFIRSSETNLIEFKQQLTDGLEKEAVAFLNSSTGGVIFIGINKQGDVVGISNVDYQLLQIKDRLKNNILPSCMGLFDLEPIYFKSNPIIKITLASGVEKPYYIRKHGISEKGCFIRTGTSAEPMTIKQIEAMFSSRVRNSLSKILSPREDLYFEQLKIYYEAVGKSLNNQFAKSLELLTSDKRFNYVAYLMADNNGMSMKVAKYTGFDRVYLAENHEYGYCSLVKAAKQILDKVELENITFAQITSKERIETRLWDMIALREAIINAIVHNDYTREVPPKVEFFDDRIEITSYGGLPEGLTESDFFEGVSMPRNKEIMRIFKDLDLVEQLGSGIPRILQSYDKTCFQFLDNFIRMSFPKIEFDDSIVKISNQEKIIKKSNPQQIGTELGPSRDQVKHILIDDFSKTGTKSNINTGTKSGPSQDQVKSILKLTQQEINKITNFCIEPKSLIEIMHYFEWSNRTKFRMKYIQPLLK